MINDDGVQVISRLLLTQYLSFFMFLTLTCKSCLCLSIDQSWGGISVGDWQLSFSHSVIFLAQSHTHTHTHTHNHPYRLTVQMSAIMSFLLFQYISFSFHHTPGPQHRHNHLFTNNHIARQCLTSLYSGLFFHTLQNCMHNHECYQSTCWEVNHFLKSLSSSQKDSLWIILLG